ncbi:hypothetical protein O6V44_22220, partial [Salmonella enterica subsp. enterica]
AIGRWQKLYLRSPDRPVFRLYAVSHTHLRLTTSEINGSFKGWQDRFIPNAIPAVDVAALLPFSPNAATLGFVFCTFGTIFSMGILLLIHSPIMVLPGFVPLFFSGGPIGVLANRMGGYRS